MSVERGVSIGSPPSDQSAGRPQVEGMDSSWKSLYKFAGAAVLIAVLLYVLDIVLTFGGGGTGPAIRSSTDWFRSIQANWLFELRNLGLINVIALSVAMPLYLALFVAHRRTYGAYALLALIIYLVGSAIYIANNPAIPMFALSGKFTAATTDTQRTLLAAAGEAILAGGEDFTPGAFVGFIFTEIAGIIISFVMLRGRIFGKAASITGILGYSFLSIYTVLATFVPSLFNVAMIIALVGGLSVLAWYVLVGRRLFQLSGQWT